MIGPDEAKLAYATLMIGKETIAYNDKSGVADDCLEKILTFYFRLHDKLTGTSHRIVNKPRRRTKKII